MAYNQDYRYYRPTNTSYPPKEKKKRGVSFFQSVLFLSIGFSVTYISMLLIFEHDTYLPKSELLSDTKNKTQLPNPSVTSVVQNKTSDKPATNEFASPIPQTLGVQIAQDEKLLKLVEAEIPKDNGEYAIAIKEVGGTDHQVLINHQTIYPSGSLYKLYVMAAALEKVDKGEWSIDTVITGNTNHLEEVLGSIDFGYEDKRGKTISYTLEETLGRISRISDNFASIMLAEKLDWEYVRDYAKRLGANNTVIRSPISTTAEDTLHFFDLLYQKKIVSESASDTLIDLLTKAQLNQRIPAKLPKSKLKIAHKTGELPGVRHDAGIVFLEKTEKNKGPYIIVLMSKDLKGEDSGVETLADISKVVYDYFNSQNQ